MTIATNYHNEGSTDPSLVASWRTRTFGAGAVPIASGIVYFAGGSDQVIGDTTLNVALVYCSVTKGFTGGIGTNGTPATIAVNTNGTGQYASQAFDYAPGGGKAYVTAGTNGIGQVNVKGAGKLYLTGGTINTGVAVSTGELDVNSSVVLNSKIVDIYGGSAVIDYKSGDTPTVNMYGGTLTCRRGIGTLNAYGGNIIVQVEKAQTGIATLNLLGDDAVVDLRAGDVSTTLNLRKGTFILAGAVDPIDLSAATTTIGDVSIMGATAPGAKVTWNSTRTLVGMALDPLRVSGDSA